MHERESHTQPEVETMESRGCQGCGWPIDTTALRFYCRICDPKGTREANSLKAEKMEAEYHANRRLEG